VEADVMPRITSTIIAVLLAIAAVAAMLYTAKHDTGRGVVSGPQRLLQPSDLPIDEIDRITITRGGAAAAASLVYQRTGPNWNQVEPFAHPMDPYSIRQMAVAARELTVVDRIPPTALGSDQSLSTLQLSPAAGEITYQWPGGSLTLELGRRSVAGRAYLRRKGEDAVCIVNQKLHERVLDMNPAEWRDRTIFLHAGADSSRIGWQQGDVKMSLERDGRRWKMTDPLETRVDQNNLDAYLQALGRATVTDYILDIKDPAELANFGLAKPVGVLTITTTPQVPGAGSAPSPTTQAAPITERLLVGSPITTASKDRFGMIEGRPVVVRLSEPVIGALFRQAEDLAAATGAGVKPADVKSIVIRQTSIAGVAAVAAPASQPSELSLERDLDRWRSPSHGNLEVNAAMVQELLDQLCTLQAPNVQFKTFPRELEVATVTLYGFDGKALDTVRIAQEKTSPSTALENGDNVLRVFPQGLKLRLTAGDFGL